MAKKQRGRLLLRGCVSPGSWGTGPRRTARWLEDRWDSSRRPARCFLNRSPLVNSLRISPQQRKKKVWRREGAAVGPAGQGKGVLSPLGD